VYIVVVETVHGIEVRKSLEALTRLKRSVMTIARRDYGLYEPLRTYLLERFRRARQILSMLPRRLRSIDAHGIEGYRIAFLSGEAVERGIERSIAVKTLDGRVTTVATGTPIERAIYVVEVSRWRIKCSCMDAILLSTIADSKLSRLLGYRGEPIFYRYTLCKHSIAALSLLLSDSKLSLRDRELRTTLRLCVTAAFLRVADDSTVEKYRDTVSKVVEKAIQRLTGKESDSSSKTSAA